MSAAKLNLKLERGTSLYRQIRIKGEAVPEGTTFRLYILADINDTVALEEFTSAPLLYDLGTAFTLELPPEATLAGSLPLDNYPYKIEAVIPESLAVIRVLQGNLRLSP